jgi:Terminase RNaseH-like domain
MGLMSSPFEMSTTVEREVPRYYCGVDLGQSHGHTAIAILRRVQFLKTSEAGQRNAHWKEHKPSIFQLGYLERVPLGTTYPGIVAHVQRLLAKPAFAGQIDLAIDQTGVGAPVADLFKSAGVTFAGVMITNGADESSEGTTYRVPKMTLVSRLQALLHEGRLQIQKELPEAAELVRELQDFRVRFTEAGHMTFGAREGKHDDLVLALSIAAWRSTKNITKTKWTNVDWIQR